MTPAKLPFALCDGAGIPVCADCMHNKANNPTGPQSAIPDYDVASMKRGGVINERGCRWWSFRRERQ